MSLTSYRAAPPRDKPLRALSKTDAETNLANARGRRSIRSGGFLRRQPGRTPLGASGMYQREPVLERVMRRLLSILSRQKRASAPKSGPERRSCQKPGKSPALEQEAFGETSMDQPLKCPGHRALEEAFRRMFGLSRTTAAPTLGERLDRLKRLRAAVSDNEARFEQAISADFGHRSTTETTIA